MRKIVALPHLASGGADPSILTITSNVEVYGQKTGNPDGRRRDAVRPGANPDGWPRPERGGGVADPVAKLPFTHAKDGTSYTFSIVPAVLGKVLVSAGNRVARGTATSTHEETVRGQHLNVNVLNRESCSM
ncbi:hypothetical protein MJ561_18325 [Klebsiella pneumoniae]|nr:hypothetical protein MJ561_18325 [Klebsiella pneumoniae]